MKNQDEIIMLLFHTIISNQKNYLPILESIPRITHQLNNELLYIKLEIETLNHEKLNEKIDRVIDLIRTLQTHGMKK